MAQEHDRLPRPPSVGRAWTSFVADPPEPGGKPVRGLHEQANDHHRLRVEHNRHTLLVHLSGEQRGDWTTLAVDRETRRFAVGQGDTQRQATSHAYDGLYEPS